MKAVRFLEKAAADVDAVLDWYINECDAPEAAAKWRDALEQACYQSASAK